METILFPLSHGIIIDITFIVHKLQYVISAIKISCDLILTVVLLDLQPPVLKWVSSSPCGIPLIVDMIPSIIKPKKRLKELNSEKLAMGAGISTCVNDNKVS